MTDPPGETSGQSRFVAASNRSERNSLSGKNYLPRRSVRSDRVPAHIGEALPLLAKGNPEGSPSDPVTTDPKGEAGRSIDEVRAGSTCNTPALIMTRQPTEFHALDPSVDPPGPSASAVRSDKGSDAVHVLLLRALMR